MLCQNPHLLQRSPSKTNSLTIVKQVYNLYTLCTLPFFWLEMNHVPAGPAQWRFLKYCHCLLKDRKNQTNLNATDIDVLSYSSLETLKKFVSFCHDRNRNRNLLVAGEIRETITSMKFTKFILKQKF